jgi:hypothetical protein
MAGFILISCLIYFNRKDKAKFNNTLVMFCSYFVFIFIIQSQLFGETNTKAFVFLLGSAIILPFFLLSITKQNFIQAFIDIIFFFSITSLAFWILSNIFPSFYEFTSNIPIKYKTDLIEGNNKMFIIYAFENSRVYNIIRNPGPTWEPGGWAVFLTIAMIFNLLINKRLINIKNLLFIINILSTFSTTAYIALAVIILHFLLFSTGLNFLIKVLAIPLFIYISLNIFKNAEFMQKKIDYTIQSGKEKNITEERSGRFFGLRKAIVSFSRHPFSGRGIVNITEAGEGEDEGTGYGILDLGTRFGVIAIVFYIYFLFKSLSLLNKSSGIQNKAFTLTMFIIVILHVLSQTVYSTPLLMMLLFVSVAKVVPSFNKG